MPSTPTASTRARVHVLLLASGAHHPPLLCVPQAQLQQVFLCLVVFCTGSVASDDTTVCFQHFPCVKWAANYSLGTGNLLCQCVLQGSWSAC